MNSVNPMKDVYGQIERLSYELCDLETSRGEEDRNPRMDDIQRAGKLDQLIELTRECVEERRRLSGKPTAESAVEAAQALAREVSGTLEHLPPDQRKHVERALNGVHALTGPMKGKAGPRCIVNNDHGPFTVDHSATDTIRSDEMTDHERRRQAWDSPAGRLIRDSFGHEPDPAA